MIVKEKCNPNIDEILPSRGGLEVERPLRIQLKTGHSYLGGFESCLGMLYGSSEFERICCNSMYSVQAALLYILTESHICHP